MNVIRIRGYVLSLPEVTVEPHFHYASFRVRGKIFITVPPEQTHVHVLVNNDERDIATSLYPAFVEKLLWGGAHQRQSGRCQSSGQAGVVMQGTEAPRGKSLGSYMQRRNGAQLRHRTTLD